MTEDQKDLRNLRRRFVLGAPAKEIRDIVNALERENKSTGLFSEDFAKARVLWADALIKQLEKEK